MILRRALRRASGSSECSAIRNYAAAAIRGTVKLETPVDPAGHLEIENARILRVVRNKMAERATMIENGETDSAVGSSISRIQRARALKNLEVLSESWKEWNKSIQDLRDTLAMTLEEDAELRSMAEKERDSLVERLYHHASKTFPKLLIPPSKTAQFSALMELRAGAGGDEASLFLGELLRVYTRIAVSNGLRAQLISFSGTDPIKGTAGGGKDAMLEIKGDGAYDKFRFESGVHRVQRVPATETKGRLHTSTVAVVVLPSSDGPPSTEEADIVNPKDVRTDVMRAGGAGGQHVNRTESAVRLVHEPTGITVMMQDSRSQHQNREKAWQVLRARLLDRKLQEEQRQRRETRRDIVRSADRSEKIRTYNFPQDRLTDHRINYSMNNLTSIMEGDGLEDMMAELVQNHEISQIENLLDESIEES